ncbi:MAG: Gfo/Idh/MocA family oxidoreductase [Epulopiscium sp.]|nr:Gfo/Idh/MocA family oxidoreductase [Candidatus Epulonipiscium sp.]
MKKVKIGILSFEHMHAFSYAIGLLKLPNVELVGIWDDQTFRGTEMASKLKTKYYSDYQEFLKEEMDGVIICTSNVLHKKMAVAAAKAGKHILVEKPFATNEEDARAMIEAAKENNVQIMTAFPMRFDTSILEAKAAVDRGEIGDIISITGINHGKIPSGWFISKELAGGGAVMDHTVHLADLMRWFTGSEYTTVYCESGELIHNKGIDDCGIVTVEFENGVFGTIDCSWAHHKNYPIWPDIYMRIVGTKGVLEVDAFKQTQKLVDASTNEIHEIGWGSSADDGLVKEFVRVVQTGDEPKVTGIDGTRAMEVAIAAYRSTESHQVEPIVSSI